MFGENLMPRLLLCDLLHNRNLMHGAGPGKARQVVGCSMAGGSLAARTAIEGSQWRSTSAEENRCALRQLLPAPGVHRRTHRYTTFYELTARSTFSSRG